MASFIPLVVLILSSFLFILQAQAVLVNYTIDDTLGDSLTNALPTYSLGWAAGEGGNCSSCPITPSPDVGLPGDRPREGGPPFQNTWHENYNTDSFSAPSIELTFKGSKVYIYGIIFYYSTTNVSFRVDGVPVKESFYYQGLQNPLTAPFYTFNTLLYSNENLSPDATHTVEVLNAPGSVLLFDYAVYSKDNTSPIAQTSSAPNPTPSSPNASPDTQLASTSKKNLPLIVGASVGAALFVILTILVLSIVLYRRRRRRRHQPQTGEVIPYLVAPQRNSSSYRPGHKVSPSLTTNASTSTFGKSRLPPPPLALLAPIQQSDSGLRGKVLQQQFEIPPTYSAAV